MSQRSLSLATPAQFDLQTIRIYSSEQSGAEHAASYSNQLFEAMDLLLAFPELGLVVDPVPPELRRLGSGSHFIYYRIHETEIEIIRVLHESADQSTAFE